MKLKVGKIEFTMDKNNLRLRARIGSNLTFIGGKNNNGYFESIEEAKSFIESKKEDFLNCKTMKKLIWL